MTISSRLAFIHGLKELTDKYRISIIDNYEGLVFFSKDDDSQIYPKVEENGEWTVELGFGWRVNDFIGNEVLKNKVEMAHLSNRRRLPGVLVLPGAGCVVYYLIDKDGNGSWFVQASAYNKSTLANPNPVKVTREFPIDNELFYRLLNDALEESK
jgi:hypothetical protein